MMAMSSTIVVRIFGRRFVQLLRRVGFFSFPGHYRRIVADVVFKKGTIITSVFFTETTTAPRRLRARINDTVFTDRHVRLRRPDLISRTTTRIRSYRRTPCAPEIEFSLSFSSANSFKYVVHPDG